MGPAKPKDPEIHKPVDIYTEYQQDFDRCIVREEWKAQAVSCAKKLIINMERYEYVSSRVNKKMPPYVVGLVHMMEANFNWNSHLHNGDPLTARTTHVPPNRPEKGKPPFTWEESAIDALIYDEAPKRDFSDLPHVLRFLEGYNGMAYRKFLMKSPYLYSGTDLYTRGKFVRDNVFDPNAVSKQIGVVPVLKCYFKLLN